MRAGILTKFLSFSIIVFLCGQILLATDGQKAKQETLTISRQAYDQLVKDIGEFTKYSTSPHTYEEQSFLNLLAGSASRVRYVLFDYSLFLSCYNECQACPTCSVGLSTSLCTIKGEIDIMEILLPVVAKSVPDNDEIHLHDLHNAIIKAYYTIKPLCPFEYECDRTILDEIKEDLRNKK